MAFNYVPETLLAGAFTNLHLLLIMKKTATTIALLLLCLFAVAQETTLNKSVLFGNDSYKLDKTARKKLDSLVTQVQQAKTYTVRMSGNTDTTGTSDYNKKLSDQRMKSVAEYLASKGIDKRSFQYKALGESVQRFSNADDESRQKNRRVDLVIVLKGKRSAADDDDVIAKNERCKCEPDERDTTVKDAATGIIARIECVKKGTPVRIGVGRLVSAREADSLNISTMTENGDPLVSAGMFRVCPEARYNPNAMVEVKVPLENLLAVDIKKIAVWEERKNNDDVVVWHKIQPKINVVRIGGKDYAVYKTRPCTYINFDAKLESQQVFIAVKKHKVERLRVVYTNQLTLLFPLWNSGEKHYINLAKQEKGKPEPTIEIKTKDKKGREYTFSGHLSGMKYSPVKNTYTVRRKQLRRLKETCKTAG